MIYIVILITLYLCILPINSFLAGMYFYKILDGETKFNWYSILRIISYVLFGIFILIFKLIRDL